MTTTTERTITRTASDVDTKMRAGGALLAVASLAFVTGLAFHPPPSPDPGEFMATIAEDPVRWMVAHWASAVALSAFATAGLIVLTAGSRLTEHWWTVVSWAVLIVGALWVTTAAVAEATVITAAATAGDTATFEAWQRFAGAYSVAFVAIAGAVAVIAGTEARGGYDMTPAWASWVGAIAGVVALVGYVLGLGLGVALAGPVWLASAIVMSLWTLWFGVALARSESVIWTVPEKPEPGGEEPV